MGHNRLGRLRMTLRWREVISLLDRSPNETERIAQAAVLAADHRFAELSNDPAVAYCFWLLTRIAWAARGPSFGAELADVGVSTTSDASAINLIAQIGDQARRELRVTSSSGYFAEIASLALRSALSETVGQQGRSLFGSTVEDAQQAFREYSTKAQFAVLARRFFAGFMSRSLRSLVDRELSNHVGGASAMTTVAESREFLGALDTHAWQAARIVEDFSGGWYSKRNWETAGEVSLDDAQKFSAVALRKLRGELRMEPAQR